jgi:lycopene cyclase domain-containing protein
MGAYTLLTIVAVVAVVAYEVLFARTGIFRTRSYWLSMAIIVFFQVLVDGWLTKRSAPVVIYDPDSFSGVRVGFHSPLEDFGFGFALVTLTMVVWDQLGRRSDAADGSDASDRSADLHPSSER